MRNTYIRRLSVRTICAIAIGTLVACTICASQGNKPSGNATAQAATTKILRTSLSPVLDPKEAAALRKDADEETWEDAKGTVETGLRLFVPEKGEKPLDITVDRFKTDTRYCVDVTGSFQGRMLFKDQFITAEGVWNVVEAVDSKKYFFAVSQTDVKDTIVISMLVSYVYDGEGHAVFGFGMGPNQAKRSDSPYQFNSGVGDQEIKVTLVVTALPQSTTRIGQIGGK